MPSGDSSRHNAASSDHRYYVNDSVRNEAARTQTTARAIDDEGATVTPRAGDILHVTREASVQFTTPMLFRVIRVHDWPTYDGWLWLDGYQLNAAGDAVERRSIFVQRRGLHPVRPSAEARNHNSLRPRTLPLPQHVR
jgi:hypothetical protein